MRDAIIKKIDLHKLSDEKLLELYDLMLDQPRKMSPEEYTITPLIDVHDNELNTNFQDWVNDEQVKSIKEEIKPSGIVYHIDLQNNLKYILRFSEDELLSHEATQRYSNGETGFLIDREQLAIIEKNINIIQTSKYPFELDIPYMMAAYYDAQSNQVLTSFKVTKNYNDIGYSVKLIPNSIFHFINKPAKCAYYTTEVIS